MTTTPIRIIFALAFLAAAVSPAAAQDAPVAAEWQPMTGFQCSSDGLARIAAARDYAVVDNPGLSGDALQNAIDLAVAEKVDQLVRGHECSTSVAATPASEPGPLATTASAPNS